MLPTISGEVPQVTWGKMSSDLKLNISSNFAPSSEGNDFQYSTASSNNSPFGANGLSFTYAKVFSSGATIPALAPASIAILHNVILPSIDRARMASPPYSITCPVPPAVPIFPIINIVISFAVTPSSITPFIFISIFFCFFVTKHWVAKTCSTSLVPIPIAKEPKAPCVDVWESPHTIVIPGKVSPCSGPITWTMPCLESSSLNWVIPNSLQFSSRVMTCNLLIGSFMPSRLMSLEVVGTLWSGVARIEDTLLGFKLFCLSPSKAWGEVTSCTKCLSTYIKSLPSSLVVTKWSSQILS